MPFYGRIGDFEKLTKSSEVFNYVLPKVGGFANTSPSLEKDNLSDTYAVE